MPVNLKCLVMFVGENIKLASERSNLSRVRQPDKPQAHFRAYVLIRGCMVTLFYCFMNAEVQNTLRHHFQTWKTKKSLRQNRLRSSSRSKDWSPRSRTESLRLYTQPTNYYHKRESCTSEVTTTTLVTVNGGPQGRSPFLQPPRQSYGGNV
ncbi:hypothetical protein GWI33_009548 [Rhynchophorus ferrugineus]|uniref:Uncharacterized protein n=1 Tax=Rhynchophorus ferrugineus TaxID=354439 RepID=A0A834MKN8_RHYFE|nr:hypothetical protein GWI33_009548 [Rhynchophorus ferrugineus]